MFSAEWLPLTYSLYCFQSKVIRLLSFLWSLESYLFAFLFFFLFEPTKWGSYRIPFSHLSVCPRFFSGITCGKLLIFCMKLGCHPTLKSDRARFCRKKSCFEFLDPKKFFQVLWKISMWKFSDFFKMKLQQHEVLELTQIICWNKSSPFFGPKGSKIGPNEVFQVLKKLMNGIFLIFKIKSQQ